MASRNWSDQVENRIRDGKFSQIGRQIWACRVLAMAILLLGGAFSAFAQQQQPPSDKRPAPPDVPSSSQQVLSELTKDNLDRVAASPAQLKAVLVQDTGLLVELKRWIAKEASDNGQVIVEQDLTDSAVYDRLTNDV